MSIVVIVNAILSIVCIIMFCLLYYNIKNLEVHNHKSLEVQNIDVKDKNGAVRGRMGLLDGGSYGMEFSDDQGNRRLVASITRGGPIISLNDLTGKPQVEISQSDVGNGANIMLYSTKDPQAKHKILITLDDLDSRNEPRVEVHDRAGKIHRLIEVKSAN